MPLHAPLTVGILTASDRCFRGLAEDLSGRALERVVRGQGWSVVARKIVPDREAPIRKAIVRWCDEKRCALVLTTGGTGIGPRDVTPEATRPLLERELPGFSYLMFREGVRRTRKAALSRALAGLRRGSLILNLPGSPKGARENLASVLSLIPHALSVARGGDHGTRGGSSPNPPATFRARSRPRRTSPAGRPPAASVSSEPGKFRKAR